jgi:hypothetical protein
VIGSVQSLVSTQSEGGTSGACDFIVEKWYACPGIGLCAITPSFALNVGPVDPKLAIVRVR